MHRRSFLKFLLSTPLAAVVDYEKLLWVPGEKTIFIPSPKQVEIYNGLILEEFTPISSRTMRIPLSFRPGGIFSQEELGILSYRKIGLDEAVKDGHIHPYEIPSITQFLVKNGA